MNKFFTFLLLLCGCICQAQDRIAFSYDGAGNQIQRSLPSDDYWYSIELEDGRVIKRHFALKR